jgi:beta-glucosidase
MKPDKLILSLLLAGLSGLCLSTLAAAPGDAKPLYLDPAQPVDARVNDLISRLTLEEKGMLLDHIGPDIARFGIRSDQWNQCAHGVVWDRPTTMFPVSIAMAATWDTALVHQVASSISDEARAIYNDWRQDPNFRGQKKGLIYRAPVINISRNPYWGRINECFGEDPYLTGRLGVNFVQGLQGDDPKYLKLVSTLKHFAVNNVERDRKSLNATVSERMLYEYWLPHFRDCIVEGRAQSVMASYNAINGTPNNMNNLLLTDILKKQWGFQGFVVSDLGGVNTMVTGHEGGRMSFVDAVASSINAGCDFSDIEFRTNIPTAVRQGKLPEARLNDAVFRVMRERFRLGEFDPPDQVPFSKIPLSVICSPEHRQLSLRTEREAIVLLQNKGDFLPLDRSKIKSIAVLGPAADIFTAGGYSGRATNPVTPLAGVKNRMAPATEVVFVNGGEIAPARRGAAGGATSEIQSAAAAAAKADVAIVYVGTTLAIEGEGRDRPSLGLPGNQLELVKAVVAANPRTVVVEMNAGPITEPWMAEHVPALIEAWWGGEEGGNAIADVIFGDVNPAGRMPLTVYASADQVPPQDEYDVTRGFTYMYLNGKPLFPFGHGLSYTTFKYGALELSDSKIASTNRITATIDITNTGRREGDEVVQLYVHEMNPSVKRPGKELRGFQRVHLLPGETKKVEMTVPGEKLAFYDESIHRFRVKPGGFQIMIGASSEDIRATREFEVVEK